ncbi:tRNA adenosine(34) deaminase TadA [Microbacterium xanthum]|uniref:tRNA adenosine(34) deaminase TadA n=1 Tax=Microbacterium xanthum TaxID=3079794 RepID=UPI003A1033CD
MPLPASPDDLAAMRHALDLAGTALASGEVPVGALVLDPGGAVIGEGRNLREHEHDPTAHAEIIAMRRAAAALSSWNLAGCTLVVTLEPCLMCAGALLQAHVSRVVFGAWDDKAGAVGSMYDVVRDRRLPVRAEVVAGVCADESAALLRRFFDSRRDRPASAHS